MALPKTKKRRGIRKFHRGPKARRWVRRKQNAKPRRTGKTAKKRARHAKPAKVRATRRAVIVPIASAAIFGRAGLALVRGSLSRRIEG